MPTPMPPTPQQDGPLAIAGVVFQKWEPNYELDVALRRGTVFPSLDLPFAAQR